MIRIARQYLLRLTLRSGRQIEQWVATYTVTTAGDGSIARFNWTNSRGVRPEILGLDLGDVSAIQLVEQRRRVRFGRSAA